MSQTNTTSPTAAWTSTQAYILSVACLAIGIAGGWFVRGSQSPATTMSSATSTPGPEPASAQPTPEQMRHMADKQAEPLLSQLKSDPNNPALLASVGNIYYDTQQFPTAIDYYQQSLHAKPDDASVRTDMATAYWYLGNVDTAIVEFNRALAYEPNKPNALFNLGIVQWQGKMNVEAALSAWQELLDTNPNYENKPKLLELMAQVRKHSQIQPGTQAKATAE